MIASAIIGELQYEAISMQKMLERLPADQFDWKPQAKSMSLGELARHIVDLSGTIPAIIQKTELDYAQRQEFKGEGVAELIARFQKNTATAIEILKTADDDILRQDWTFRNGDQVIFNMPRVAVLRGFAIKHMVHHRGQLSVYLRLLDIPVPSIYGPSADEAM